MSSHALGATPPSITVRPSAAEKARFATLARVAGVSESALALMAIRAFLEEEGTTGPSFPGVQQRAPIDACINDLQLSKGSEVQDVV